MTPSTPRALRWMNLLVVLTLILPPSPVFAASFAQLPNDPRPQGESSARSASNSAALAEEELRAIAPRSRPLTTTPPRPYLPAILRRASPASNENGFRPDRAAPPATELPSSFAAQSGGGRLWAGTSNAGVWLYENGVWSQRSNGLGDVSRRGDPGLHQPAVGDG